jgi:hypothetical protein
MRRQRVAAGVALIATLAAAAVPGSVGSQGPSPVRSVSADLFREVDPAALDGIAVTTPTLNPAYRSLDSLNDGTPFVEPDGRPVAPGRPNLAGAQPQPDVLVVAIPQPKPRPQPVTRSTSPRSSRTSSSGGGSWHHDPEVSWYGPGFYGNRTACGQALTKSLIGVAHRTLPCGTRVTFRNPDNGRVVRATVVDRGPYVSGRQWDMTGGLCLALDHCYTGPMDWRFG